MGEAEVLLGKKLWFLLVLAFAVWHDLCSFPCLFTKGQGWANWIPQAKFGPAPGFVSKWSQNRAAPVHLHIALDLFHASETQLGFNKATYLGKPKIYSLPLHVESVPNPAAIG